MMRIAPAAWIPSTAPTSIHPPVMAHADQMPQLAATSAHVVGETPLVVGATHSLRHCGNHQRVLAAEVTSSKRFVADMRFLSGQYLAAVNNNSALCELPSESLA